MEGVGGRGCNLALADILVICSEVGRLLKWEGGDRTDSGEDSEDGGGRMRGCKTVSTD
jgi:hypothetical protein